MKGIPFLAFDAGGVLEMFDPKEFSDNVVFEPTLAALKRKLAHVVERGRIKTVQLAEHITTGRQQWLQWHADFADSLPKLIEVSSRAACMHWLKGNAVIDIYPCAILPSTAVAIAHYIICMSTW